MISWRRAAALATQALGLGGGTGFRASRRGLAPPLRGPAESRRRSRPSYWPTDRDRCGTPSPDARNPLRYGRSLRIERPDGRLSKMTRHDAESAARLGEDRFQLAVIATNTVNIFQAYLLGISLMLGGRRMAKYVPGMNRDIQKFALHRDEWKYHEPAFLPFTAIPVSEALNLVDEADRCQAEFGFRTSLPLVASAWEGQAAARLDSLLSMDFKLLFDEDLV